MELIKYPAKEQWASLLQRPAMEPFALEKKVARVLAGVKKKGDKEIRKLTREWDGVSLRKLAVTDAEIKKAEKLISPALLAAMKTAAANISAFHAAQALKEEVIETMPGVKCWRRSVPVEKAGLYIPGGTAPLFSTVLMLAIPARLAGCPEIVLCTPPQKDGTVHPAVLCAAQLSGVTKIFKAGGAQAIAAMAYGTESIPAVSKIFGPGNQFVTCAKQLVQRDGIAIDMPAGPSEVCVLADDTAHAAFVAADLLSQAEHGADSQVLLITTSEALAQQVQQETAKQLAALPRQALAFQSLQSSRIVVLAGIESAISMANQYAAEHLILACSNANAIAEKVTNAGSVFIGHYSPESVGDYASGTNHTLPTSGYARAYSGVSLDSFVKKITFQELTREGLSAIAGTVITMAEAEGLEAHAKAVKIRL